MICIHVELGNELFGSLLGSVHEVICTHVELGKELFGFLLGSVHVGFRGFLDLGDILSDQLAKRSPQPSAWRNAD